MKKIVLSLISMLSFSIHAAVLEGHVSELTVCIPDFGGHVLYTANVGGSRIAINHYLDIDNNRLSEVAGREMVKMLYSAQLVNKRVRVEYTPNTMSLCGQAVIGLPTNIGNSLRLLD